MEPWHKVATPRKEVREGGSFNRTQGSRDGPIFPTLGPELCKK